MQRKELNNIDIFELNFDVVTYAKLRKGGVGTVYELLNLTKNDILHIKGIGVKRFKEIEKKTNAFFGENGIDLVFPIENHYIDKKAEASTNNDQNNLEVDDELFTFENLDEEFEFDDESFEF